jgi:hypothetical protein
VLATLAGSVYGGGESVAVAFPGSDQSSSGTSNRRNRQRENKRRRRPPQVTVYHATFLHTAHSILTYGFFAEVGRPTLSEAPYQYWVSNPVLVFKVNRDMVKHGKLTDAARTGSLPERLRSDLLELIQNETHETRGQVYGAHVLLRADKFGKLGRFPRSALDVAETLNYNAALVRDGSLKAGVFGLLKDLLHGASAD